MKNSEAKPEKNTHILESMWEIMCGRLEMLLPDKVMHEWISHFKLIKLTKKRAVILYIGNEDLSQFQNQYYAQFSDCLYKLLRREVKITFKQKRTIVQKKRIAVQQVRPLLLGLVLLCAAMVIAVVGVSYVKNLKFRETFYQVSSGKVNGGLRIIQLSDLHETDFGENNKELVRRIGLLKPDMIVMTGDMIEQNKEGLDVTLDLCSQLTEIAPVYYIYGNNECRKLFKSTMSLESLDDLLGGTEGNRSLDKLRQMEDPLYTQLEDIGVHVLMNESETLKIRDNSVDIYGVLTSNPSAFWPYAEDSFGDFIDKNTQNFKLLACHEPLIFDVFGEGNWGDLILCGDTHGGVIRLPYLGGLYTREAGLLPELRNNGYVYGRYEVGGNPLIVSSGLTNRGCVRINNQPELVIIDVNRY